MSLQTQIITDLDAFFSEDDFAVEVAWTPAGGVASTVTVIWNDNYQLVNTATGEVTSAGVSAEGKTSDFLGVAKGDTVVYELVTYYIRDIQDDGTGVVLLMLSRN